MSSGLARLVRDVHPWIDMHVVEGGGVMNHANVGAGRIPVAILNPPMTVASTKRTHSLCENQRKGLPLPHGHGWDRCTDLELDFAASIATALEPWLGRIGLNIPIYGPT